MDLPTDHQARKALDRPFKEWKPPRGAPRRGDEGAPAPSGPSPAAPEAAGTDAEKPRPGTMQDKLYRAVADADVPVDMDYLAEATGCGATSCHRALHPWSSAAS